MFNGVYKRKLRKESDIPGPEIIRPSKCLLILIFAAVCLSSVGCHQRQPSSSAADPTTAVALGKKTISNSVSVPIDITSTSLKVPKASPLEKVHKEYLEAYERYVQALRENGPQTMETLNALADYQRKYQLYQMILRAEDH